jgi:hypothetical protein
LRHQGPGLHVEHGKRQGGGRTQQAFHKTSFQTRDGSGRSWVKSRCAAQLQAMNNALP